jgi:hypothetical protein
MNKYTTLIKLVGKFWDGTKFIPIDKYVDFETGIKEDQVSLVEARLIRKYRSKVCTDKFTTRIIENKYTKNIRERLLKSILNKPIASKRIEEGE